MTVIAIIAAALLIVLVAVLLMPVVLHITYCDTFALRLSYAGFTIPTESNKTKKKSPTVTKSSQHKKKSKKMNKMTFDEILITSLTCCLISSIIRHTTSFLTIFAKERLSISFLYFICLAASLAPMDFLSFGDAVRTYKLCLTV